MGSALWEVPTSTVLRHKAQLIRFASLSSELRPKSLMSHVPHPGNPLLSAITANRSCPTWIGRDDVVLQLTPSLCIDPCLFQWLQFKGTDIVSFTTLQRKYFNSNDTLMLLILLNNIFCLYLMSCARLTLSDVVNVGHLLFGGIVLEHFWLSSSWL